MVIRFLSPSLAARARIEEVPNRGRLSCGGRYRPAVLGDRPKTWGRKTYTTNFPLEHDSRRIVDAESNLLAKSLDISRRGTSCVDQKVGMLLRDHRAASLQAAAPDNIDQAPCRLTRRVCKGRA